jgi:hypothetical protein
MAGDEYLISSSLLGKRLCFYSITFSEATVTNANSLAIGEGAI